MTKLLWVALRELEERRALGLFALCLGAIPFLVPLLPGLGRHGAAEVRTSAALVVALTVGTVLAVALGSSMLARELVERRLGYSFAQPLQAWQIWGGKLTGATALLYGSLLLTVMPALLWDGRVGSLWEIVPVWVGHSALLWLAPLLLLLFSHVAGVALRVRSPWLLLDALMLPLVCWLAFRDGFRLSAVGAWSELEIGLLGLASGCLLGLGIAGWIQVARGRCLPRASHRWLSASAWSALLLVALGFDLYVDWVFGAEPRDILEVTDVAAPPAGDWLVVRGRLRHRRDYRPSFLFNPRSGGWENLGQGRRELVFSADGTAAAEAQWVCHRPRCRQEVVHFELGQQRVRRGEAAISVGPSAEIAPWTIALSANGARMAVISARRIAVHQLPGGRLLATVAVPGARFVDLDTLAFWNPKSLRVIRRIVRYVQPVVQIVDLDISKPAAPRVREAPLEGWPRWVADAAGRRLLVLLHRRGEGEEEEAWLFDADQAAPIAPLASSHGHYWAGTFLGDGRALLAEEVGGQIVLRLFSDRGEECGTVALGPGRRVWLGPEWAPGRMLAGVLVGEGEGEATWKAFDADLDRLDAEAAPFADGLVPVGGARGRSSHGLFRPAQPPAAGGSSTTLFWRVEDSTLVRLDPGTGVARRVFPLSGRGAG